MTWQHWAEQLDGKLYKTDDGIEVQLSIPTNAHGYTSTINGHPTKRGRATTAYRDEKRKLGDDWSYCWEGAVPGSLFALIER